ncbi:hypothetical protein GCM10027091_07700 [Streptomyces daliensis]
MEVSRVGPVAYAGPARSYAPSSHDSRSHRSSRHSESSRPNVEYVRADPSPSPNIVTVAPRSESPVPSYYSSHTMDPHANQDSRLLLPYAISEPRSERRSEPRSESRTHRSSHSGTYADSQWSGSTITPSRYMPPPSTHGSRDDRSRQNGPSSESYRDQSVYSGDSLPSHQYDAQQSRTANWAQKVSPNSGEGPAPVRKDHTRNPIKLAAEAATLEAINRIEDGRVTRDHRGGLVESNKPSQSGRKKTMPHGDAALVVDRNGAYIRKTKSSSSASKPAGPSTQSESASRRSRR